MSNIVVIKRYNTAAIAQIDASFLRSEGIECAVNGDNSGTIMPYITEQITLSTLEENAEEAKKLLGITDDETQQ